jgi:efflux transporter, RND family, MFP subunit
MNMYRYMAALMLLPLLAACGSRQDETAPTDTDERAIVDIDRASVRNVPESRSYTANVEAENLNNISPAMANRIRRIHVDVGDHVSRGQVLVELDAATADQQRISLENTETEYNRALELLRIGAGTQRSVDQLKAQLDAARAQYRNTMDNTVLRSPISGVVTARNYDDGDMTGQLPVLTVGQVTPSVKVTINVNENDLSRVSRGMPVDITFDAFPGESFSGKITRLQPAVDVATRTFQAEVSVANPGGRILPGMFARADINLGEHQRVVVPDRAVVKQTGSNGKYVYVYHNGTVSFNKVELGQRLDDAYELISGVNDGDTVVITGQTRLADGAAARINTRD